MRSERPVWCAKCYVVVASHDLRTTYNGSDYHQGCFLKLVQEEAEQQRAQRSGERRKSDFQATMASRH